MENKSAKTLLALTLFLAVFAALTIASASQVEADVTSMEEVEDAVADFPIRLEARVKNTGEASLDSGCAVKFWVRGPGTNGYVGSQNLATEEGELKEDEKRWYGISWTPKDVGDYNYWARVWCNGFEISDWSDPEAFHVDQNTAEADVTSLEEIEETLQGTSISLEARVKNTGDIDLEDGCGVWFYLKSTYVTGFIGSEGMDSELEPNERRWYSIDWTPRYAGYYKYWARVYCSGRAISDWSTGEIFKVTKRVKNPEILQTKGFEVNAGNQTTLWALVKNNGNTDLGSDCSAGFWVRGNGVDKEINTVPLSFGGILPSKDQRWYGVQWTPTKAGEYRYWAKVSCDGKRIGEWYPKGGQASSVSA